MTLGRSWVKSSHWAWPIDEDSEGVFVRMKGLYRVGCRTWPAWHGGISKDKDPRASKRLSQSQCRDVDCRTPPACNSGISISSQHNYLTSTLPPSFQLLHCVISNHLKGVWQEIFNFKFFHGSVSPGPLSISLGPFQIFFKNSRRFREWMFISVVNDTGNKRENFLAMQFFIFC